MAKIYSTPTELGAAPQWNIKKSREENIAAETAWVDKVKAYAKKYGNGKERGEYIHFPIADGHAQYIVYTMKPVALFHLDVGDGWHFPQAKYLTAKAVREEVERQTGWDNFLKKHDAEARARVKVGGVYFYSDFLDKEGAWVEVTEIPPSGAIVTTKATGETFGYRPDDTYKQKSWKKGTVHTINASNLYVRREDAAR